MKKLFPFVCSVFISCFFLCISGNSSGAWYTNLFATSAIEDHLDPQQVKQLIQRIDYSDATTELSLKNRYQKSWLDYLKLLANFMYKSTPS